VRRLGFNFEKAGLPPILRGLPDGRESNPRDDAAHLKIRLARVEVVDNDAGPRPFSGSLPFDL